MSSQQPEVESQTPPAVAAQADITQQATSPTPKQHVKNPKRVAAGKMVAEKTRKAVEEQKKAVARAEAIIAKNMAKATAPAPEPAQTTEVVESPKGGLSVNQWIGIGGLVVSAAGIYPKREELMAAFKKNTPEPEPLSVELEPMPAPRPRGIRNMD